MISCISVAVIVPAVVSQSVLLTSTAEQICPGGTVVFTCTTTGSSTLVWQSEEYIGSGSQLEFRSIDPIGTLRNSTSHPDTVANLTANGPLILTSVLRIVSSSTTPNVSASCINAGGETSTSTIPSAGM